MHEHFECFTQEELAAWALHRRAALSSRVVRAANLTLAILAEENVSARRLLVLSEREIRNPDWRSNFINRCTIVVRSSSHLRGRLGLWEEGGTLCLEIALGDAVLVVRRATAEIHLAGLLPAALAQAAEGGALDQTIDCALLDSRRGKILRVERDQEAGVTKVVFRTRSRQHSFAEHVALSHLKRSS